MRFVRSLVKALSHYTEVCFNSFRWKRSFEIRDTESCVEIKCFESRRKEF